LRLFFRKRRIRISQNTHLPFDVQKRIEAEYRFLELDTPMYVMVAITELLIILILLFSGLALRLGSDIIHQKSTFVENLFLFGLSFFTLYTCYANFKILKSLYKFLQFQMYSHLYAICRYVTPEEKRRLRIPQVLLRYHIHFDYGFDDSKIIFLIKNQRTTQDILELEAENVVDSTAVVQPLHDTPLLELPSGEVLGGTSVDLAQKLEAEVSPIERKNHEQVLPLNDVPLVEAQPEQKQDVESSEQTQPERCHLLISIGQTVSFTLEGEQTKERVTIRMNPSYTAIMTYLALQPEEDLRKHTAIAKALYGDENKKGLFNKHTSRIRELIRERVPEKFIYTPPVEEILDAKQFDPFEQEFIRKDDSRWHLSSFCHITGTNTLTNFYRRIKANDPFIKPLERKEWQKRIRLLREIYSGRYLDKYSNEEEYSGGYLSKYLQEDAFKDWALVFFKEYRTQYIYVLEHVAENERRIAVAEQNDEGIQIAAEHYKECAYAASCSPIDQKSGEHALRKCIDMYILINNIEAAQAICSIYAKRIKNVMSAWEPEQETKKQLDKHRLVVTEHYEML